MDPPSRSNRVQQWAKRLSLKETLLNIGIAIAILGGSYAIMHFFARAMYVRCESCMTLNARRRSNCRACGARLQK
jgi:hypothetical protein